MEMLDDLMEDLGYEHKGKIKTYLLLLGSQTNEDELRLISKNSDKNCICAMVKEGHRYHMFYLERVNNVNAEWDDVFLKPCYTLALLSVLFSAEERRSRTVVQI